MRGPKRGEPEPALAAPELPSEPEADPSLVREWARLMRSRRSEEAMSLLGDDSPEMENRLRGTLDKVPPQPAGASDSVLQEPVYPSGQTDAKNPELPPKHRKCPP